MKRWLNLRFQSENELESNYFHTCFIWEYCINNDYDKSNLVLRNAEKAYSGGEVFYKDINSDTFGHIEFNIWLPMIQKLWLGDEDKAKKLALSIENFTKISSNFIELARLWKYVFDDSIIAKRYLEKAESTAEKCCNN